MIAFSKTGDPCTDFERALLDKAKIPAPQNLREQWVSIGQRIGADNLVIVLDEFASTRPYVTPRRLFFADLYRPLRIDSVVFLRGQGFSGAEIAKRLGISERTVDNDMRAAFASPLRR
jgi:hypothetical protein